MRIARSTESSKVESSDRSSTRTSAISPPSPIRKPTRTVRLRLGLLRQVGQFDDILFFRLRRWLLLLHRLRGWLGLRLLLRGRSGDGARRRLGMDFSLR